MYSVGSEVLTAVSTKMAVLWVVAPSGLVIYRRFRVSCCDERPNDVESKELKNVGKLPPDNMAPKPERHSSSNYVSYVQHRNRKCKQM
jgi:hypothetical protein